MRSGVPRFRAGRPAAWRVGNGRERARILPPVTRSRDTRGRVTTPGRRDRSDRHGDAVVALVVATLAVGIPVDASGAAWAQPVVSLWSWAALAWIAAGATRSHRLELAVCVVLATAGELFLKDVWGLYAYRLGNLPWFIPAGHALVFAAATRLTSRAAQWLPGAVVATFAVVVGVGAWRGYDTFGLVWFTAFAAYVRVSANPRLCATLFLLAFAIETYGTTLGGWTYVTREPWFGLTTTNPPVWIGAIYCTLETLVRVAAGVVRQALAAAPGRPAAAAVATPWSPRVGG